MILSAILCTAFLQTGYPSLPPGLNANFTSNAYAVEELLASGKSSEASARAQLLPKRTLTYAWDDSAVPTGLRPEYREALQLALTEWKSALNLNAQEGQNADIRFVFVSTGERTGSGLPLACKVTFGTGPLLNASLAVKRSEPVLTSTRQDIHNEVAFVLGQYAGLERLPSFGSFLTRTEQSTNVNTIFTAYEQSLATKALDAAESLRTLASQSFKDTPAIPQIAVGASAISGLQGTQAQPLSFDLQISNKGTGDLNLLVRPDCGCLAPSGPVVVKAGETGTVHTQVNTAEFVGHLKHNLLVYSNDPKTPLLQVPVEVFVEPLYRFVMPGPSVAQITHSGADVDVYLVLSKKADMRVLTASLDGPKADVSFAPWKGILPQDAEQPQEEKTGYKFHVKVAPIGLPGRVPGTLTITTDNDDFHLLYFTFELQKGIVLLPPDIRFGTVKRAPRQMSFLVSRPGKGFKITKVDTDSPYFSAAAVPVKGDWEYRINVQYDGRVEFGAVSGTVTVHTDDPTQPTLTCKVAGMIE